ncbi:hypothetical protein BD779DRAFT_1793849 [Infundibulicybe gibba]|nr:hypothetical protein BD779DRAFT_1793849 [Infundibulicybe gibba]
MTWGDRNESAGTLTNSYLQCECHGAMAILLEPPGNYPSTELHIASADLRLMREGAGAWKMKGHLVMKCRGANWVTFGAAAFLRVATNAILERISQGQYHVSKVSGDVGVSYYSLKVKQVTMCARELGVGLECAECVSDCYGRSTGGASNNANGIWGVFNDGGHTNCFCAMRSAPWTRGSLGEMRLGVGPSGAAPGELRNECDANYWVYLLQCGVVDNGSKCLGL